MKAQQRQKLSSLKTPVGVHKFINGVLIFKILNGRVRLPNSLSFLPSLSLPLEVKGLGTMGSTNSRLGSHPNPPIRNRTFKRTFSSLFICGASSSRSSQMEDDPAELLVNSAEHDGTEKLYSPGKDSTHGFLPSQAETGSSSARNLVNGEKSTSEGVSNDNEGGHQEESPQTTGCKTDSTSQDDRPFLYPLSLNRRANVNVVNNVDITRTGDISQVFSGFTRCSSPLSNRIGESSSNDDLVGTHANDIFIFNNSDSGSVSVSAVSDSPVTVGDDLRQEAPPSGIEFLLSEREQGVREGSELHVDVVSISSNIFSNRSAEIISREARRNSRRRFWDAFARRSPRRGADSRNFHFPRDDSDGVLSHDRLQLDFSDDSLNEGVGGNFRTHGSRTYGNNERQLRSRSEMWERLRDGLNASDHQTAICPAGIHLDGPCSCETLMTRESGSRASISRIVMLAEALFEVLDEIHQQPMSRPLSMLSLPAPESVVDSFPVKNHTKTKESDMGNNVLQCHICLAEYDEGDKIRVLPCHHEFHMLCVDKWLKEIHGVCPLCRGDVRNCLVEDSASNSAVPSL